LVWCKLHHGKAILLSDSKYDDVPRLAWKERLKQMLVCRFDAALCAGRDHRMYLEGLGMKAERIFEGVDVVDNDFFWQGAEQARRDPASYRATLGLEFPEPFFLASARLIERKNIDGLLRAYAQYRHHVKNAGKPCTLWRLVVLGDGTERTTLEEIVDSQGIQGVSFPGFLQINKLPTYYGLASVFIHPAHRDQWGLVVNEAMAAGLPVLVSNGCGCASDLVCEGENGFTFDSNDVATLADLMIKVSSGKVDMEAMGVSSRNRIEGWGLKRFAQGLYGALQFALQRNQAIRKFR
jgi:glycosyltransferase involved in cell wall biosynthesis